MMRKRAVRQVARIAVTAIASAAATAVSIAALGDSEITLATIALFAVPFLFVGAFANRWWTPAIAATVWAIAFLTAYAVDPTCSSCGEDDTWISLLILTTIVYVIPSMAAIALGVALRRALDALRKRKQRRQHVRSLITR